MKTFKSYYVLTAFMALTMVSKGFGKSFEPVTALIEEKTITLTVDKTMTSDIQVQIIDVFGTTLLSESVPAKDLISRKYNLKNLPDGAYNMEISDDKKILTKKLIIEKDIIAIVKEDKLIMPICYINDNTWTLAMLPFGKDVTITIHDETGTQLFTESFDNKESVSRKYDLSELEIGQYKMTILVDNKVFEEKMNVLF